MTVETATLDLTSHERDDVVVVTATGTLAPPTAPLLRDAVIDAMVRQPIAVILDVDKLRVPIPTHGLGIIDLVVHSMVRWTGTQLRLVAGSGSAGWLPPRGGPSGPYARAGTTVVRVYPNLAAAQPPELATARRRVMLSLPALARSVPEARAFAQTVSHRWNCGTIAAEVELITSELTTNALRHARSDMVIRFERLGSRLSIAVSDSCTRPAVLIRDDNPLRPFGRGLSVVRAVARLGQTPITNSGKTVWAVLECPTLAHIS